MSEEAEKVPTGAVDEVCAACGKPAVDDVKLKKCTACRLVSYCSVDCQKENRKEHKGACKKRAKELYDEKLFEQTECFQGDCPICFLPLPLDKGKSTLMTCCGKLICNGCCLRNLDAMHSQGVSPMDMTCPFCRDPFMNGETDVTGCGKRMEANDPAAFSWMGNVYYNGDDGLVRDFSKAVEMWKRAADLGDVDSLYRLGVAYHEGRGVDCGRNMKKSREYYEKGALKGHPDCRYNLGVFEKLSGNYERSLKHFKIASAMGFDRALDYIKQMYKDGEASKEDYASAMRAHKEAVDATKSPQREAVPAGLGEGC